MIVNECLMCLLHIMWYVLAHVKDNRLRSFYLTPHFCFPSQTLAGILISFQGLTGFYF